MSKLKAPPEFAAWQAWRPSRDEWRLWWKQGYDVNGMKDVMERLRNRFTIADTKKPYPIAGTSDWGFIGGTTSIWDPETKVVWDVWDIGAPKRCAFLENGVLVVPGEIENVNTPKAEQFISEANGLAVAQSGHVWNVMTLGRSSNWLRRGDFLVNWAQDIGAEAFITPEHNPHDTRDLYITAAMEVARCYSRARDARKRQDALKTLGRLEHGRDVLCQWQQWPTFKLLSSTMEQRINAKRVLRKLEGES